MPHRKKGRVPKPLELDRRYQVTIPPAVRDELGLEVGDLLEADVEADRIVLTRKAVINKGLKESLAEARARKLHGPFRTAAAAAKALKRKPS